MHKVISFFCFTIFFLKSISAECNYTPNSNEGYLQLWNLESHSNQYYVYITFLISNLGNGSFNNGITIYLYDKKEKNEYLKTIEYTNKYLKAVENQFALYLENDNYLIYKNNTLSIRVDSGNDKIFNVKTNINFSIHKNNTIFSELDFKNQILKYQIIFTGPKVFEFKYKGKEIQNFGSFGLECLLSTDNPLYFADSFFFIRNFDPNYKFFFFFIDQDKSESVTAKVHFNNLEEIFFSVSSYNQNTDDFIFDFNKCIINGKNYHYMGGFEVFNNVSFILRWFLKLIGINPFIKHYKVSLHSNCFQHPLKIPYSQLTIIKLK